MMPSAPTLRRLGLGVSLGMIVVACASPAFAQTATAGGSLTSFLQMPDDRLVILKANTLPVLGRKIRYFRERVFTRRLATPPPPPSPVSLTCHPSPGGGVPALPVVAATLAANGLEAMPPEGASAEEIDAWVERFLDATSPDPNREARDER